MCEIEFPQLARFRLRCGRRYRLAEIERRRGKKGRALGRTHLLRRHFGREQRRRLESIVDMT
jgi:hypothetical protein